jgi:hypothetical protein
MKRVLLLAGIGLLIAGCASPNVNPPRAHAKTGYVDFYADPPAELSWDVARFEDRTQDFKDVFSELDPPRGGFLRLAFAPGHYRFRITFMNLVVSEPGLVEVEVADGMITPVRVELTETGVTTVRTKKTNVGSTVYGRWGRTTKIGGSESATYRVSAVPQPTQLYQPKQQMPYGPKPTH